MKIRIPVKRAVYSAGRQVALKGGLRRPLKIMIRCGLLRDGFHWPILIFRKAKGLKALNPTTRICENSIFNQYFKKQVIANYIVLNRFYEQAAETGKPSGPKFETGRSFPVIFRLMSERHYVYVDRIQYLNRFFSRHENKDQAQKNMIFFAGPKNIKDAVSDKRDVMVPETQLTVKEVFQRKNRARFVVAGIPEARSAFSGNGPSSAQRSAYVLEKSESLRRFPAEDRIFRMVAEYSAAKDRKESGQTVFPSRSAMLLPEGAGLRETGVGRIERLFSGKVAVLAGNKAVSAPIAPQTGRRQTVRLISKEEGQVFSRVVADRSIGMSIDQRFDPFQNALRSPDRVRPEFSRNGFGQGQEGTQALGQSGTLERRAAQLLKETEVRVMKSALKRPEPDQAEFILPGAGGQGSEVQWAASRSLNRPAGENTIYLNKKIDHEQSPPGERPMIAPVEGLKTAGQNKRFTTRIIAQSRRILNRVEQTNTLNSGLQKETSRQQNGMRQMRAGIDSVSVFQEQTKAERSGASRAKSFSSGVPGVPELAKESGPGRSMPEFARVVYQKQGIGRAFSAGRQAAPAPNGPGPWAHASEFVLKKEGTPGRQTPANRQAKEAETAEHPAQTIYESDVKKNKAQEIHVIAERVYKIIEKRITIERDRRGLS
jgi:hypothetical protein